MAHTIGSVAMVPVSGATSLAMSSLFLTAKPSFKFTMPIYTRLSACSAFSTITLV
jgi:hypothetical protein